MTDEWIIETDRLTKKFGDLVAVDGVTFDVAPGESFGFLGPNGAGKSTTINILCTLLRPTSGSASVAGFDVATRPHDVRRHIGLVFQDPTLDEYLTAEENLRFHAELYGVPRETSEQRLKDVLEMVELWERRKSIVNTFSVGCAGASRSRAGCCTRRASCSSTSRPLAWIPRPARTSGATSKSFGSARRSPSS